MDSLMYDTNTEIPVVAHVMRGYLTRTETFIGNQIVTLRHFKPVVFCHHRISGHSYPMAQVVSGADLLSPFWRRIDRWMYRLGRVAVPQTTDALARYALEHGIRLMHFHYLVDARFFIALKHKTRLPALVSAYGYDVSEFPNRYGGYGRRYLEPVFGQADYVLAMSHDMCRDMVELGCPRDKIIVHYYGTDTSRFVYPKREYRDKDQVTVLACASLYEKKGQHLTLQALRLVEQRRMAKCHFRVVFAGDGPMRLRLERQVAEYGWQDKVAFLGHIPHHEDRLVEAYRQADIFSLPSMTTTRGDKEGIPGTIVEAMAAGLPVLSAHHAGIPDVIESGREGILVREADVEAMACALAALIDNAALRERLGCAAAKRATTELDLHRGTAELEDLYRRVL